MLKRLSDNEIKTIGGGERLLTLADGLQVGAAELSWLGLKLAAIVGFWCYHSKRTPFSGNPTELEKPKQNTTNVTSAAKDAANIAGGNQEIKADA